MKILGFDLGDGESAVTILDGESTVEPRVMLLGGQMSMLSAVAMRDGRIVVGEEASVLSGASDAQVRFKSRYLVDSDAPRAIRAFAQGVMAMIMQEEPALMAEVSRTVVGCPAGWGDMRRSQYAALIESAGFPNVQVVPEPRAAFLYARHARGLRIDAALMKKSAMVIDIGSSTTDFAYIVDGHQQNLAAFGALCCNSRRLYLYGLYKPNPDFLHMLHRAPRCGSWGFVVPVSKKLAGGISACCPWEIDLYTGMRRHREKGMRSVRHHALITVMTSVSAAAAAILTAHALIRRACALPSYALSAPPTLMAMALMYIALRMMYRAYIAATTCPRISEHGVSAGGGLSLSWEEVRFGYVHRMARFSGLFLLSEPLCVLGRAGCPPVRCLSMPDSSTLILAYLTYCPHASKGVETKGTI